MALAKLRKYMFKVAIAKGMTHSLNLIQYLSVYFYAC